MKSLIFTDRRGDEYGFRIYSTGQMIIRKQKSNKPYFSTIEISEDAAQQLFSFINRVSDPVE